MTTDPRVAEASRLAGRVLDEVEKAVVGKREALMLVMAAVLAKGHVLLEDFPGPRQDAGRALVGDRAGPRLRAGAVHPRPAARRPDRVVPLRPARRARSSSAAGRCSPACCWPTRSTGPRPRRSRRCSRRCRSARSPWRARPSRCRARSTCSPRPTRSSTRAPTRCPRPSSTGSCCGSASATRCRDEEYDVLTRRLARQQEEVALEQVTDAPGVLAMQAAVETVTVEETRRPLLRRPGRGDPGPPRRAHRRLAARVAGPGPRGPGLGAWCAVATT